MTFPDTILEGSLVGPRGLPGVNAVPADEAVAAYVADPVSETAAALAARIAEDIDPLQDQIDNLSTFGTLRGDWSASPGTYVAGDLVTHSDALWGATGATVAADVPGVAAVWQELPAVGDPDTIVRTTDAGAPVTEADYVTVDEDQDYVQMELDPDDRMSWGTMPDGTQHFPRGRVDYLTDAYGTLEDGADLEVNGEPVIYVEKDADDRVVRAVRPDGTNYFPKVVIDNLGNYWAGKSITVVGTSITEGYNATSVDGVRQGFVWQAIARELGAELDNEGVASSRIMWLGNNALSLGATQAELTAAAFDPAQSYEVKVLGKDADLYVFDHGYNDRSGTLGTISSTDPANFYGAYNRVLEALYAEKPDAQIMFITPPSLWAPVGGGYGTGTAEKRTAILALGEKWAAPVLDLSIRSGMNEDSSAALLPDTVHPSHAAHTRMARQLAAFIRGL